MEKWKEAVKEMLGDKWKESDMAKEKKPFEPIAEFHKVLGKIFQGLVIPEWMLDPRYELAKFENPNGQLNHLVANLPPALADPYFSECRFEPIRIKSEAYVNCASPHAFKREAETMGLFLAQDLIKKICAATFVSCQTYDKLKARQMQTGNEHVKVAVPRSGPPILCTAWYVPHGMRLEVQLEAVGVSATVVQNALSPGIKN